MIESLGNYCGGDNYSGGSWGLKKTGLSSNYIYEDIVILALKSTVCDKSYAYDCNFA